MKRSSSARTRTAPALLAMALTLATIASASGKAHALGADIPYAAFAAAPDVDWVQVCGQWPAAAAGGTEGAGTYRIVHATRYAQSFLYVQWLRRDSSSDSAAEVHTEGVAPLNNDHAEISLSQMRCQATRQGIRFTARAESGHDGSVFRITIDAGHLPGLLRYRTSARR